MALSAKVAQLKAEGRDIIGLGAGEPDFDTPEHIKDAAIEAIRAGFTKYTAVNGTPELIQAVTEKFKKENQLQYNADQILVSCGCKHSLYNLMQALLNPGDEVIVPAPYWVSYPDIVALASAETVIIRTLAKNNLKMTAEELKTAITSRTKLLILNSPSNPTGMCYTTEELEKLGAVLLEHPNILVVSDDIYEHILWDQTPFQNIVNVCPELYHRTIVCNGVSKAYAMTGWRIGYAGGPKILINAMKKIQSQSTSNANSIAQVAAQIALTGDQSYIAENTRIFKERHDYVYQRLSKISRVKCRPAQGAFYIFPAFHDVIKHLEGIKNDLDLAEYLLEKAGVAMVPGSAFGAPGYIRISFATDMQTLEKAMDRLEQVLSAC